jgi:hypothetical protein
LRASLDLLEEKQSKVAEKVAIYQSKIARHFNKKVRVRSFKEGDLVLRKVTQNTRRRSDGVLAPNWEGPYWLRHHSGVVLTSWKTWRVPSGPYMEC